MTRKEGNILPPTVRKMKGYRRQVGHVAREAILQGAERKEDDEALQAVRRMKEILRNVDARRSQNTSEMRVGVEDSKRLFIFVSLDHVKYWACVYERSYSPHLLDLPKCEIGNGIWKEYVLQHAVSEEEAHEIPCFASDSRRKRGRVGA